MLNIDQIANKRVCLGKVNLVSRHFANEQHFFLAAKASLPAPVTEANSH